MVWTVSFWMLTLHVLFQEVREEESFCNLIDSASISLTLKPEKEIAKQKTIEQCPS